MNANVGAWRLIDCIAETPWAGGMRRSAGITNDENANITPPTSPEPTAATPIVIGRQLIVRPGSPA